MELPAMRVCHLCILLALSITLVKGQPNELQSCTFEPGQSCSLSQRRSTFQVTNAKRLWASGMKGPKYDHTLGNKKGLFAYVPSLSGTATYYTTLPFQQGSACVRFWHMGDCPGYDTKVYLVTGTRRVGVFEVDDEKKGLWRLQQITLTLPSSQVSTLEIVVTYDSQARPMCTVALDDFQLIQGACPRDPEGTPVRLIGGVDADEGRVEVQWNGQWGAICNNGFGWAEALTVCRTLGKTGGRTKYLRYYGRASRIWLDGLKCPNFGSGSLDDCHHNGWGQVSCKPENYAKVRCNVQEAPTASNRIRLADIKMVGSNGLEGRLEVREKNKWGSVCANQFDSSAAKAVCSMFGFIGTATVKNGVQGQVPTVLGSVRCNSGEVDFFNCNRNVKGSAACSRQAVIGCSYVTRHFPYTCSYRNSASCSITQLSNDDYDWRMGTDSNFVSIIKCNSQAQEEGTCSMLSETIDTPHFSGTKCLRFDYHMSDRNAGELRVYVRLPHGGRQLVMWTAGKDGERAQGSFSAQRDITDSTFEVEFEATCDPKYNGYIGIRGFSVTAGLCSRGIAPPTSPTSTTTPQPSTGGSGEELFMCDFDQSDDCQELTDGAGDFTWTRHNRTTPSSQTGPDGDRKGNSTTDQYMYIETSSPRVEGDRAVLQSKRFDGKLYKRCIKLWYHMYGRNMGSLVLYWDTIIIASISGDQGRSWKNAQFDIPRNMGGRLKIEGVRGKDYRADIAIDEVQLIDGPCIPQPDRNPCLSMPCKQGAACEVTGDTYRCVDVTMCTFDKKDEMCGLTEVTLSQNPLPDPNHKGNWLWTNDRTPSAETGPSADHTSKTAGSGGYIYFEASQKRNNSIHTMESSPYTTAGGTLCLKFYYHMYGKDMGRFEVKAKGDPGSFTKVKSIPPTQFGYQEGYGNAAIYNKWIPFEETVTRPGASTITIRLNVICGRSYRSDVAIDDFIVKPGRC